jgi:hypothetical protein
MRWRPGSLKLRAEQPPDDGPGAQPKTLARLTHMNTPKGPGAGTGTSLLVEWAAGRSGFFELGSVRSLVSIAAGCGVERW